MVRISNIKIKINDAFDAYSEGQALRSKILFELKISENQLIDFSIFKKSVDARKKEEIVYVYTLDIEIKDEAGVLNANRSQGITTTPDMKYKDVQSGREPLHYRPVVIGMGPAGLFAGLLLAKRGYRPILLERGEAVEERTIKINKLWNEGVLDFESNVQFGEGGAGTFSDGKLTTLINDPRCHTILEEFVKAGAPEDILYKSKPHIGTDKLRLTVKNIRQEIMAHGGEVRFNSKVTDFTTKDGKIAAVVINGLEEIPCSVALLAIGHSARDTFAMLFSRGVKIRQKAFSIGLRIEHPQVLIDRAQYGNAAGYPGLGSADYKLSYHSKTGRSAYTFCMCPGGFVVAAASEEQSIVTNGMSKYKRDGENANSALLVGVTPNDFGSEDPLAGIEFQRRWEGLAFQFAGGDYRAPIQLTADFLKDQLSTGLGDVNPTYRPGVTFAPLKKILPLYITETLKEAIVYFDKRLKGFAMPDSILTGVETRSSSPVRIIRNESNLSNLDGLYPAGEGAGYAGGIMSSAVDGIKTAEKIIQKYAPFDSQ